jgi:GMP synthase (glutamine-hydrolysing)
MLTGSFMQRPICVIVTGEPMPLTREIRGSFFALIRQAAGAAWAGPWQQVDGRGAEELPESSQVAGLIITGSASSVTSREPWMLRLEAYLRRAVPEQTPILGLCFGHQLLGQALGGRVTKNPLGREIGTVEVERLADDPLLGSAPRFMANATHVDSIVELPRGAAVLARTAQEPFAALRFAQDVYGVQFHPEVDAEVMLHYVNARRQLLVEEGVDADALTSSVRDTPDSAAILKRFVARVSERETR